MRNLGWLLSCGRSMRFLSHASFPVPFPTLLAGGSEWSLAFFFFSVLFCHWLFFGYAFFSDFRWAVGVGLGLLHSCAMPCAGVVIEPLCFWMVLWCRHAVLPFPSFGLVFSFHLVCLWFLLALPAIFLFSCLYCAFLLCLYWVLDCE